MCSAWSGTPTSTWSTRCAGLIRAARRPVVVAGHGARNAAAALRALAERFGAPVPTTFRTAASSVRDRAAEDFRVWHTALVNPDRAAYARRCGATGIPVDRHDQLARAMAELFAAARPTLLRVEQDAELL